MRLLVLASLAGLVTEASKVTVDVSGLLPEYCGAPLVESSAWILQHSQDIFWSYIDHLTNQKDSTDFNQEKIISALKEVAKEAFLNVDLLKDALKSRSQSPSSAIHSSLYTSLGKRTSISSYPPCRSWIQYGTHHLCDPSKLSKLIPRLMEGKILAGKPEEVVTEFDSFVSRDVGAFPVLVLWADPEDVGSWAEMHKALMKQARIGEITYVLRFIIKYTGCKLDNSKIYMSGYGASFEVKMEDGQDSIKAAMDESKSIFSSLGMSSSSLDSYKIVTSLPEASLHDLGVQATKLIVDSYEPLSAFKSIVSNLPLLASSISKSPAPSRQFIEQIAQIQRRYHLFPQMELLAVNGIMIESAGFSLPGLQAFAARYSTIYNGVKEFFDYEQAEKLLRSAIVKHTPTFDTRSSAVIWLNDLESDAKYATDPKQLRSILRHSNTGFYGLSRNLVNAVLFIDPSHEDTPTILKQMMKGWIDEGAPIRFGIVLANGDEKDDIAVLIRSFYAVVREHGQENALLFLDKYFEEKKDNEDEVDLEVCYKAVPSHKDSLEDIADASASRKAYTEVRDLNSRLTIGKDPVIFFNGRPTGISSFDQDIVDAYKQEIAELQQLVFKNELTDGMSDLYERLMAIRNAHKYRNTLLTVRHGAYFDITKIGKEHVTELMDERRYMYPAKNQRGSKSFKAVTASIWIIVDVHRRHELDLIHSALSFLSKTDSTARVQLLLANPIDRHLKSVMISYREMLKGNFDLDKFAGHLEKSVSLRGGATEHLKRPGPHGRSADYEMALGMRHMVQASMMACGVGPAYKDPMIFVNGRLVATVGRDDPKIAPEHFEMLVERENIRIESLKDLLPSTMKEYSDVIIRASSFQSAAIEAIQTNFGTGGRDIGAFPITVPDLPTFRVGKSQSLVHVQSVIDPLTTVAQRCASIISACADSIWFSGQTWLNPIPKLAHLPLPVFYRFADETTMTFTLPQEGKFAVQLDAPPAWDTVLDEGSIDPDNISTASQAGGLDEETQQVKFKLRGLVVEAKLELAGSTRSLGGLQVLARDRFTSEIIEEVPVMGEVNIAQFGKLGGRMFYLEVEEKAAKTLSLPLASSFAFTGGRNLKYQELKQHKALDSKANLSTLSQTKPSSSEKINVFSIASGAMYERLIRIMMTSVTKRCKDQVKFWLIDTFATPQFRDTIKTLSDHYGFEYEFVHFRWPVWLRRQVKKHRTVWAYKVLFLDQIFPKDVERVVYVDADQVVRSDLKELVKTDMKGAPWGFVPFCDSRKETEQFRFWKTGYWKTVLEEKPYHISALFLLDLKVLRESGLGDRLRRDYHMLSIDPNSLANLDQDLPNHMQDDHPIHSLPQEWLWCETWCSDETKLKAKSIDLCNYPGKKETKVEQGQRIIPEWKEYDHEIKFILDQSKSFKQKADL